MNLYIMDIGNKKSILPINVPKAEELYNSVYIGDFCIKDKYGRWTEEPCAIFYNEYPTDPSHTNYFALFVSNGKVWVTKGDSAFEEDITGIIADNGEIIFSRYRHDYVVSMDKSVAVDGGRDYFKITASTGKTPVQDRIVKLRINKDKLEIIGGSVKMKFKTKPYRETTLTPV